MPPMIHQDTSARHIPIGAPVFRFRLEVRGGGSLSGAFAEGIALDKNFNVPHVANSTFFNRLLGLLENRRVLPIVDRKDGFALALDVPGEQRVIADRE